MIQRCGALTKVFGFVGVLFLGWFLQTCGSGPAVSINPEFVSNETSCTQDNGACFTSHFRLVDENDASLSLITLSGDLPQASSSDNRPVIESVSLKQSASTMTLTDADTVTQFFVVWSDPVAGQRPGLCFQVCPKTGVCETEEYRCVVAENDGLSQGIFKTWFGYQATSAMAEQELLLKIIPLVGVSQNDAGQTQEPVALLSQAIADGGRAADVSETAVLVGDAFFVAQSVLNGDASEESTGTGTRGTLCQANADCQGDCFSARTCTAAFSCDCTGDADRGQCFNLECASLGGFCGGGQACCVGLSCTNGVCVDALVSDCF